MKDVLKNYTQKRCCLVLEEVDLIKALDVLDAKRLNRNITIEKASSGKWYIIFRTTRRTWNSLISALEDKNITNILIPTKDNFGEVFYQKI